MAEAKATPRPLSPHLQVYRWTWTMAMSVFHRVTGTGLYFGIALFAIWLVALAAGPRLSTRCSGSSDRPSGC